MHRLLCLPAGNLITSGERHRESVIKISLYPPDCVFFVDGLNFLGDSWHLDPYFLWPSLVAGHSSGPLRVCLAFGLSLPGRIPLLVLRVSWLPSVFGGLVLGNTEPCGSHPCPFVVDLALNLSLAQLGASALSPYI